MTFGPGRGYRSNACGGDCEEDGDVATLQPSNSDVAEEYIRREADFDDAVATRRVYAKTSGDMINRLRDSWLE